MADEKAKKVNKGKKVRVKTDVLVMAGLLVDFCGGSVL